MNDIPRLVIVFTVLSASLMLSAPAQGKGKQMPLNRENCLLAVYYATSTLSRVKKLPPKFNTLKKLCDGDLDDLRQHGYQAVQATNRQYFSTLFGQRPGGSDETYLQSIGFGS